LNIRKVKYEATVTANGVTVKVTDLAGKLIDLKMVCLNLNNVLQPKQVKKEDDSFYRAISEDAKTWKVLK